MDSKEVQVIGSPDEFIALMEGLAWWGEVNRQEQLTAPRIIITGIGDNWRSNAQKMPVPRKKEVFYRLMLPLIMHANSMVETRRGEILAMQTQLQAGESLTAVQWSALKDAAVLMRTRSREAVDALAPESPDWPAIIEELLYKVDIIPAGLALGQAAYESGYGTSRFAAEGNALFGQWTYGGQGLKPEQQRAELGDHRIASFEWPFDSVRGYYINLMSHPAYEDFRRLRAERRAAGQPLTSLDMADGLIRYSERGQEYVDTLKGIIRVNKLELADDAVFRDEPLQFLVGADSEEAAAALRAEIETMRSNGELEKVYARMRLE
jgi:uncharacterized FlgJ-related protein